MKKKVKIVGVIIIALLVVVALVYLALNKSTTQKGVVKNKSNSTTKVMTKPVAQTKEAAKETKKLLEEAKKNGDQNVGTISVPSTEPSTGTEAPVFEEVPIITIAPGTSAINANTGEVITEEGKTVDNSAKAGSAIAPHESFAISTDDLPDSTIKLEVTSSSFSPKEFTVNRGQTVSLAVSNVNDSTLSEVFRFDDPLLKGVVIGLAHGETKAITFNAPNKAGEYTFYSGMFNHRDLGAVGTMIVK